MNGYKLKFSESALAVTLFADRHERHEDEDLVRKILNSGDVYVDVGANIGTLALTAATAVMPTGEVIAIEAHPETFKKLEENIRLNQFEIRAINSAAGNTKGSIRFSNINSDDQNKVMADGGTGIDVQVNTLDSILHDVKQINLLKIDVEGYEKFVLEGALQTMQRTGVILFESWDKHFQGFGYSVADVVHLLQQNGFRVFKPVDDALMPIPGDYTSSQCENLIALKDPKGFCDHTGFKMLHTK